jgi:hypothetical protein
VVTNELPASQSTNEVVLPESLPKNPEPAKAKKKSRNKKPTAPTAIEEEFEF